MFIIMPIRYVTFCLMHFLPVQPLLVACFLLTSVTDNMYLKANAFAHLDISYENKQKGSRQKEER